MPGACAEDYWGAMCNGDYSECPACGKTFCYYHAPSNAGGSVGGHSGCTGPKCRVVVGGWTCGGCVSKCDACEFTFCAKHKKPGLENGTNGHGCNIGCATTVQYKVNCTGKRKDLIACKLCQRAGNDYSFCAYHAMPVRYLPSTGAEEGGGHVCQGYTIGSMLFGDNASDLFLLAGDMAVTVASCGAVNPVAVTMAGNALQVAVHEFFETIGIAELLPLKSIIKKLIDEQVAATKKEEKPKEDGKKEEKEEGMLEKAKAKIDSLIDIFEKVGKAFEKINKEFSKRFTDQAKWLKDEMKKLEEAVEDSLSDSQKKVIEDIQTVIGVVKKAWTVIDLLLLLQDALPDLKDAISKKNPAKIAASVTKTKALMDKIIGICSGD